MVDQVAYGVIAVVPRYACDRDALLRQKIVDFGFEGCCVHSSLPDQPQRCSAVFVSTWRAAAQMVSMSRDDSRASGCSIVHAPPGILPVDAASHDAAISVRCWPGE